MPVKSHLFGLRRALFKLSPLLLTGMRAVLLLAGMTSLFLVFYEIGFKTGDSADRINQYAFIVNILFLIGLAGYLLVNWKDSFKARRSILAMMTAGAIVFFLFSGNFKIDAEAASSGWHLVYNIFISLLSVSTISQIILNTSLRKMKPQLLFVYSFLLIIFIGSLLLLLPNTTRHAISFLDALFTATSAVCITGLTVVNVAETFTVTGQLVILSLIQIGGIGVMTFTCFFAFSSSRGAAFQSQQLAKEVTNENNASMILKTLYSIILFTLIIEAIGAYVVYIQVREISASLIPDKILFSFFHSVSSFCNAGFSTLPANLYDPAVRSAYGLHTTLALLIIVGGLGFPIIFNTGKLLRHNFMNTMRSILGLQKRYEHKPRIINTTSRIVLWSTLLLVVGGTCMFWCLERGNVLKEMSLWEQLSASFFGAVTPRTAGYNIFDMSALLPGTVLLTILLMWIGASPMSTGGGIKTTTLVIALKNCLNIIRQRERLEINHREITQKTVNKAFAIIMFSLVWVALASLLIMAAEPEVPRLSIVFEVFSALGTVGLSLNLTPELTELSRVVLVITMFVGRVGIITVLTGVVRQHRHGKYSYPTDAVIL